MRSTFALHRSFVAGFEGAGIFRFKTCTFMKTTRLRSIYVITQNGLHTPYVFTKAYDAELFIESSLKPIYPENKYNVSQATLFKAS